jgi:competence protein ComEA
MLNRKLFVIMVAALLVAWVVATNAMAGESSKININTATIEELTQLKGVGPNHAAKIIAFRNKNGPFKVPEDLVQVPGIGIKTFEKNKDVIVVGANK